MVRKIFFLIFAALFFFSFLPKTHAGDSCSISWQSPTPVTINDYKASFDIKVPSGIANPNDKVEVKLTGPGINREAYFGRCEGESDQLTIGTDGAVRVRDISRDGWRKKSCAFYDGPDTSATFFPGVYTLEVHNGWSHGSTLCSASFPVVSVSSNNKNCTPKVTVDTVNGDTSDYLRDPQHKIIFSASNFSGDYDPSCVNVKFYQGNLNKNTGKVDQGSYISELKMSASDLSSKGFTLTQTAIGLYLVVVKNKCSSNYWDPDKDMCSAAITIHIPQPAGGQPPPANCIADKEVGCGTTKPCCNNSATCMGNQTNGVVTNGICVSSLATLVGGGGGIAQAGSYPPPPPVCDQNGDQYTCHTAIGDISTSPAGFIKTLMGVVLSIAGGLAVLLIMISGYRMMVSQGNPENIKNAKDQLTAAIIGLLFVIFSLVILQIIGVNILGLPGFK
jgi:hypothetical protein